MKVVVVTHDKEPVNGMELYRLHYPYFYGLSDNYIGEITIKRMTYGYILENTHEVLTDDVYVFSRLQSLEVAEKIITANKKLVIDIDDYWLVSLEHALRNTEENKEYVKIITKTLSMAHLVTCTTKILAERIKTELGIDAVVIKNTIPDAPTHFSGNKFKHTKVRFGWIGGVHHIEDIKLIKDSFAKLHSDISIKNKYQICLGGFNADKNNPFYFQYEKIMTDNYKPFINADKSYFNYLSLFVPQLEHIGFNKSYRRIWNKPITEYGQMYRDLDVAIIPLTSISQNGNKNIFNSCKSELKLVEAGTTNKSIIISNVEPYSQHLIHEENCLAVGQSQNWYTHIRRLINDKELRKELADNLTAYVKINFNHKDETLKLFNALKKLK